MTRSLRLHSGRALALILLALLAFSGCKRNIDLDDPEGVAKVWGDLICHRRGDLMNIQVKIYEKRMDNESVHRMITAGDARKANRFDDVESVLQFIRRNRGALNDCEVELSNITKLDGGAKLGVDVSIMYRQISRGSDGELKLIEHSPKFRVELTEVDAEWFITRQPPSLPDDVALGLVAP